MFMTPSFLLLLSILLGAEPRPVTIIHSNDKASKVLVAELNRNWCNVDHPVATYLDNAQKKIKPRLVLIDASLPKNLKYSYLGKYPAFQYGSGEIDYLDDRAYTEIGFPLLCIEAWLAKIEVEEKEYLNRCEILERDFYHVTIFPWLYKHHAERFQTYLNKQYMSMIPDEETEDFIDVVRLSGVIKEFGDLPDFPVIEVVYPPDPRRYYPWEENFKLKLD